MKKKFLIIGIIILAILFWGLAAIHPSSDVLGNVISSVKTDEKIVALTFDDGPGEDTETILNILKEKDVKATFFVTGIRVEEKPDILKRTTVEGHEIGIHGMTHKLFVIKNYYELANNKEQVENIINQTVKYYRPAYGFKTSCTLRTARKLGLQTVTWNIFPMDYNKPGEEVLVSRVIRNLKPGSIIALHDGPAEREQTNNALPIIIDQAREQGYRFVTITELLG
ncbi:polysaccharide deacetylase family protein [archaeon]|nr:polysaccharide deacetylase family protein [archaeon]MBL7057425.1 polysaccharide deacetylase family protein [Candidatus Woesearchaeota archaeon]